MRRTREGEGHVHVGSVGSDWERGHLLFRDRLRADAADRDRYAAVKRALAARDWPDMNAYADAKSDVIREVTDRARAARGD